MQRLIFNRLDRPENESVPDLTRRELIVLIPLLIGIVWMGLYPKPVLDKLEPAARRYIMTVRGMPVPGEEVIPRREVAR